MSSEGMEATEEDNAGFIAGEEAIMDAAKVLLELLEMRAICDRCASMSKFIIILESILFFLDWSVRDKWTVSCT